MKYYIEYIKGEIDIYKKNCENVIISMVFLIFLSMFFPFIITSDPKILSQMGLNLFWLALIFIHISSQNTIYKDEYDFGILQQYFFRPNSLFTIFLIKNTIHWLSILLPILCLTPAIKIFLNFTHINTSYLFIVIILTSYILHNLGTLINMVTLLFNNRNNLVGLLLIPSYIPVTIISLNYIDILHETLITYWLPQILILLGLIIIVTIIVPIISIYILKHLL